MHFAVDGKQRHHCDLFIRAALLLRQIKFGHMDVYSTARNLGIVWFIKDRTFLDSFESLCTTLSFLMSLPIFFIPYYFIGYWMMFGTENRNPSPERIFVVIQLYCLGVVFMVLTDAQKYLIL